jgi:hypothetical protein
VSDGHTSAAPAIGIVEPTFRDGQHAPVNAALIEALIRSGKFGHLHFCATLLQQQSVLPALPDGCRGTLDAVPIQLPRPGSGRLRVACRQLRNLWAATRDTGYLLVLSSGPETFFVCRLLCLLRPRLRIAIVLHGNLESAVGWRSRDPRHRLFDYRAGLGMAVHRHIRLIVLEPAIRRAMERHDIPGWQRACVIPHPVAEAECSLQTGAQHTSPLTIGYIGHAKRAKGFAEFLSLAHAAKLHAWPYRFVLAGYLAEAFPPADLAVVECPGAALSRATFLQAVAALDYACLPFNPALYEFTASGSLLDAVCGLKPVIAIAFPALLDLVAEFGPLGFVCADLQAMRALLAEPARLMDAATYAGFQANLRRLRESRLPATLAQPLLEALQVGP